MFYMYALHDMNGWNVMRPNSLDPHPCQSFAHGCKRYRWTCLFFIFPFCSINILYVLFFFQIKLFLYKYTSSPENCLVLPFLILLMLLMVGSWWWIFRNYWWWWLRWCWQWWQWWWWCWIDAAKADLAQRLLGSALPKHPRHTHTKPPEKVLRADHIVIRSQSE